MSSALRDPLKVHVDGRDVWVNLRGARRIPMEDHAELCIEFSLEHQAPASVPALPDLLNRGMGEGTFGEIEDEDPDKPRFQFTFSSLASWSKNLRNLQRFIGKVAVSDPHS